MKYLIHGKNKPYEDLTISEIVILTNADKISKADLKKVAKNINDCVQLSYHNKMGNKSSKDKIIKELKEILKKIYLNLCFFI